MNEFVEEQREIERKKNYKSARCCLCCRQLFKADSLRSNKYVVFTTKNVFIKAFPLNFIYFSIYLVLSFAVQMFCCRQSNHRQHFSVKKNFKVCTKDDHSSNLKLLHEIYWVFFHLQWPINYKIYGDKHRHLAAAVLPLQVRPIMSRQVPVAVHPTSILYSTLLPYWLQMLQQHYRWHCLPQDLLHRKQPQGRGYIHQDQHRMTYTMARMGLTHHLVLSIR